MPQARSEHQGREGRSAAQPLPKEAKPERGLAHEKLDVFLGDWTGEGHAGEMKIIVQESYDWLEGGFFLTATFDQKVGKAHRMGVGAIGYDAPASLYRMHMIDNLGYDRTYDLRDAGRGVWSVTGERERATYSFQDGGKLNVHWEHRPEGADWRPLCAYDCTNRRRSQAH